MGSPAESLIRHGGQLGRLTTSLLRIFSTQSIAFREASSWHWAAATMSEVYLLPGSCPSFSLVCWTCSMIEEEEIAEEYHGKERLGIIELQDDYQSSKGCEAELEPEVTSGGLHCRTGTISGLSKVDKNGNVD